MRRRALLTALGTLSTGCLGAESPDSSATTRSDPPTSTDSSGGPPDGDAEFEVRRLDVSTSTDRPSDSYVLEPSAFYSADAVEREATRTGEKQVVVDVADIERSTVREAVETAIEDGEWRSNDLPDGLADLVERVDFFTGVGGDDTYTHIGLTLHRLDPDAPPAVAFDAAALDSVVAPGDPGVLELQLRNVGSERRTVFSGTVPPFGVVVAESTSGGDRFLLWRPYESEGCVHFDGDSYYKCDIGRTTELAPGESVAREYEILSSATDRHPSLTAPPGPGTYRLADSLNHYAESGAPESTLSFAVEYALESVEKG